jgi:anti-sigma factor RsiW
MCADPRLAASLPAFLAGDLDAADAREIDQHLLACEDCWHAAQQDRMGRDLAGRLRLPVPAQLADRLRLALELGDSWAGEPAEERLRRRRLRRRAAFAAGSLAAAVLLATFLTWQRPTPNTAPNTSRDAVAEVVALAEQPPTVGNPTRTTTPTALGPAVIKTIDAHRTVIRYYAWHGRTVLVAISTLRFTAPAAITPAPGPSMAWQSSHDGITLYCPAENVLLAGPTTANELAELAQALHLA